MPAAEQPLQSTSNTSGVPIRTVLPIPWAIWFWRQARKIVVFVIGMTLVAFGIVGLFLPVLQGWLTIFAGLAVLATEFAWARWTLKHAKHRLSVLLAAVREPFQKTPQP